MRVTTVFLAILLSFGAAQAITLYARDNSTSTALNATFSITYNYNNSCAQETATTTYYCGTNNTGSYDTQPYYQYINYTKPFGSIGAIWMTKEGTSGVSIINTTLSSACYSAVSDRILLRFFSNDSAGISRAECYNGTGWSTVTNFLGAVGGTGSTNDSSKTYDEDYNTGARYRPTNGNWLTTSDSGAKIWEERIYWNITSGINETLNGTTGNVTPTYSNYYSGNITVSAPGYATATFSSVPLLLTSYTFNLTPASNTTFVIRDEATGSIINTTTTTISLSGSTYGTNATSTNGTFVFANLTYDYYTVTYSGTNYSQRQIFAYLPSASSANYTLYLLNDTASTLVLFTVLDQTYSVLNGVVVTALKKNLSGTNYYSVAQCTTDLNGECLIGLELYTSTYRFITEYNGIVRNSSDTVLSRNTYTIVLNTQSSTLQNVLNRNDLSASLVYTPIGRFDYTVVDSSGDVQSGLLTIERRYGGRLYSVSSTTDTGSSFVITATGVNVSLGDEIVANGYVYIDGQPILTHSISVIDSTAGGSLGSGLAFLFLGMMFTIVFIFAWNPVAPLIAFGAFVLIMSRIGIIGFGTGAVVAIIVVIGVAIYRMRSV